MALPLSVLSNISQCCWIYLVSIHNIPGGLRGTLGGGKKDESRDLLEQQLLSHREAVRIQWDALSTDQQVLNQARGPTEQFLWGQALWAGFGSHLYPHSAPNLSQKPSRENHDYTQQPRELAMRKAMGCRNDCCRHNTSPSLLTQLRSKISPTQLCEMRARTITLVLGK